mmetsp:Transcript_15286/g.43078  ORF Transcript_15286/g.43078 Transcript_15286/m.43078 type:complete len:335 (+) Transcript_15286:180-1184(+)
MFFCSSSSPLAHSITKCLPYRCVLDSAAMPFSASFVVTYSTNANPRCDPSNFFGSRTFRSCPKEPNSFSSSFRVAWNGTLRTINFVAFFGAPTFEFLAAVVDDDLLCCVETLRSSAWPSSNLPCTVFNARLTSSCDLSSTKPYPIDDACPEGETFLGIRTEITLPDKLLSKKCFKASSVVTKFKFFTYRLAETPSDAAVTSESSMPEFGTPLPSATAPTLPFARLSAFLPLPLPLSLLLSLPTPLPFASFSCRSSDKADAAAAAEAPILDWTGAHSRYIGTCLKRLYASFRNACFANDGCEYSTTAMVFDGGSRMLTVSSPKWNNFDSSSVVVS